MASNYNVEKPHHFEALCTSIRRFGFSKPVVVRTVSGIKGWEIIGGEHRWLAGKEVGVKTVPIFDLGTIADDVARQLCIVLNERGDVDELRLAEILRGLVQHQSATDLAKIVPFNAGAILRLAQSVDFSFTAMNQSDTRPPEQRLQSDDPEAPGPLDTPRVSLKLTFEKATGKELDRRLKMVNPDKSKAVALLLAAWGKRQAHV